MYKFLIVLFFSVSLFGDRFENGKQFYFSKGCSSCHGVDGTGIQNYPSLSGRNLWDLKRRLDAIVSGKRKTQQASIMLPFARNLSEAEKSEITYFLQELPNHKEKEEVYYLESGSWGDGGS
ncbi:Cytochrome c553 [Thiovulum sp. ES]|nr:Cytochrome c553 [Thiovulum sp. ES]